MLQKITRLHPVGLFIDFSLFNIYFFATIIKLKRVSILIKIIII